MNGFRTLVWGFKTILNKSMEYSYVLSIRTLKSNKVMKQYWV